MLQAMGKWVPRPLIPDSSGWRRNRQRRCRSGAASDGLDARLRQALAKASVLDLIDSLPDGLDTQVGELGDRLSAR